MPIAIVPEVPTAIIRYQGGIDGAELGSSRCILENSHIAMQGDGQVGDTNGLDDGKDDGAGDMIAGLVLTMRLVRSDVEIGEVARSRAEGQGQARQK